MASIPILNISYDRCSRWPERAWMWVRLLGSAYLLFCILLAAATYVRKWIPRPEVAVPIVVGKQQSEAMKSLRMVGLDVKVVDASPSDRSPAGTVVQQSLAPGERVREGRTIYLAVCPGPASTIVPNVQLTASTDALQTLTRSGLNGVIATAIDSLKIPFDGVVRQFPLPGVRVPVGSVVALVVSDGPPPDAPDSTISSDGNNVIADEPLIPVAPGDWSPTSPAPRPASGALTAGPGVPGATPPEAPPSSAFPLPGAIDGRPVPGGSSDSADAPGKPVIGGTPDGSLATGPDSEDAKARDQQDTAVIGGDEPVSPPESTRQRRRRPRTAANGRRRQPRGEGSAPVIDGGTIPSPP